MVPQILPEAQGSSIKRNHSSQKIRLVEQKGPLGGKSWNYP